MIETVPTSLRPVPEDHDHLWRRLSPESGPYGIAPEEYRCNLCTLIWSS